MDGSLLLAVIGEVNDTYPELDAIWRLAAAVGLGALVGLEREVTDQPAGLRTHLTVSLGAAVFGVISTLGFSEFVTGQRDVNIQFDVTRVASQVVVGVGFLGAGVIFRAGSKVRNLTTAASLWVTAAIGLAAGVGDIGIAAVATAALLFALLLLKIPRDSIRERVTKADLMVAITLAHPDSAEAVLDAVRSLDGVRLERVNWSKANGNVVIDLILEGRSSIRPETQLAPIVARDDVLELRSEVSLRSEQ
jgi:putative Mg2+ transporter-C (MgtC) family protein